MRESPTDWVRRVPWRTVGVGAVFLIVSRVADIWTVATGLVPWLVGLIADLPLPDLSGFWPIVSGVLSVLGVILLMVALYQIRRAPRGDHASITDQAEAAVYHPTPAEKALQDRVAELEKELDESRQREGGLRAFPPTVTVAPKDPKWDQGDQLMFEGLALLDEIRKGGDRRQQTLAWLEDVREFVKAHNPTAWSMFDAPTGLLPVRSSGFPKAVVDLATDVDRALYLIRLTNPRRFGRAGVAVARAKVGEE
jgi:uncharacterized membrane protein